MYNISIYKSIDIYNIHKYYKYLKLLLLLLFLTHGCRVLRGKFWHCVGMQRIHRWCLSILLRLKIVKGNTCGSIIMSYCSTLLAIIKFKIDEVYHLNTVCKLYYVSEIMLVLLLSSSSS